MRTTGPLPASSIADPMSAACSFAARVPASVVRAGTIRPSVSRKAAQLAAFADISIAARSLATPSDAINIRHRGVATRIVAKPCILVDAVADFDASGWHIRRRGRRDPDRSIDACRVGCQSSCVGAGGARTLYTCH